MEKMNPSFKKILLEEASRLDEKSKKKFVERLKKVKDDASLPEVLGINREMIEYYYTQVRQQFLRKEYEKSAKAFLLLHNLAPKDARHVMGLAASEHMLKHYEEAAKWYSIADEMDPDSPLALYHSSDCYAQLGYPEMEKSILEMALKKCAGNKKHSEIEGKIQLILEAKKPQEVKK